MPLRTVPDPRYLEYRDPHWQVLLPPPSLLRLPTPLIAYEVCSLCHGRAYHVITVSQLDITQRVGCVHCDATGWCRCERCQGARGNSYRHPNVATTANTATTDTNNASGGDAA